jgi:hypothetical protein
MQPVSTTTYTILDASTTQCVTFEPTTATGTPAVLWHYDAGELAILFAVVAFGAAWLFSQLVRYFSA